MYNINRSIGKYIGKSKMYKGVYIYKLNGGILVYR